ncbi:hypothetical protein [Sulfuricurvum sp.]|uniref:hypothetical protein n=1 Tax=Sulfuricurvum sp. TaxID=2025608 RepID=UPI0026090FA9|nr:hypothetical protein [Sulfuricurvum sp.]MDD2267468.1 hypothetical protein [Sulfuricurvum sp.]MDD2782811.1 hypothetical protein [Sulfuricurvum sp.]
MGKVADAVGDFVSDAFNTVKNAANDVVDFAADAAKFITNSALTISGIKWVDEKLTGGLVTHAIDGIIDNIAGMVHGAINGDWGQFKESLMGTITSAVAVVSIVIGGFLIVMGVPMGYAFVAAGITILDAQYNNGELLRRSIAMVGTLETALFNTHYIDTYAVEIQQLITIGASMFAGYGASPFIMDWSGLSTFISENRMVIDAISTGYGAYNIYSAVQAIIESQEYWKVQLEAAMEYYQKLYAQMQSAKEQWFSMITDTDIINRIQAGGDMFIMGAGHDLFSITSVAEPRYALGLIDKSDSEMDRLINNRYYTQYAGSDAFKIQ